jgi:hypothetical protein
VSYKQRSKAEPMCMQTWSMMPVSDERMDVEQSFLVYRCAAPEPSSGSSAVFPIT